MLAQKMGARKSLRDSDLCFRLTCSSRPVPERLCPGDEGPPFMGSVRSFGDMVIPVESLRPLFRSSAMAKAFAERLAATSRLSGIGTHGRLIFQPPWEREPHREDHGSVATRLARTITGDDLFELLRDCTLSFGERTERMTVIRTVWNNYISWFNTAANARMPPIERFMFSRPSHEDRTSAKKALQSGLQVVYGGDAIYSLRLTAAGVAVSNVLGERPSLQQRS
jgi:hypothetical protein